MSYTLNYNKPPLHSGDEIELDDATAQRLLRFGFISEISPKVEVTDESDDDEESETDLEDTDLERIDE